MIRRRQDGHFLLIPQHEHALLAGRLAGRIGGGRFALPEPFSAVMDAIAQHDCGWPMHDDTPELNAEGLPLDVFETPLPLALQVWREGVERAGAFGDYAQLLVSLHVLGLSAFAAHHARERTRIEEFELNKFQHREIERQEQLRPRVGLSTEVPLKLGMSMEPNIPAEEQLRRNYLLLQAMDRMSLAICCTEPPFQQIGGITPRAGAMPITLTFNRTGERSLRVEPWIFSIPDIVERVQCRRLPDKPWRSVEEFRAAYVGAVAESLEIVVHER